MEVDCKRRAGGTSRPLGMDGSLFLGFQYALICIIHGLPPGCEGRSQMKS
jgi:hypothetical protein